MRAIALSFITSLCITLLPTLTTAAPHNPPQQTLASTSSLSTLRLATPADAHDLATIVITAFNTLPYFQYIYQFRSRYNNETIACLASEFHHALATRSDVFAHVGFAPSLDPPHHLIPVSTGAWFLPPNASAAGDADMLAHRVRPSLGMMPPCFTETLQSTITIAGDAVFEEKAPYCPTRAINWTRGLDFVSQEGPQETALLDDVYGDKQLYLVALATLPEYQGHDYAGEVLREGIEYGMGRTEVRPLWATLSATEPGERLYKENGYESVGNVSVQTVERDGRVWRFDAMVRKLRGEEQPDDPSSSRFGRLLYRSWGN